MSNRKVKNISLNRARPGRHDLSINFFNLIIRFKNNIRIFLFPPDEFCEKSTFFNKLKFQGTKVVETYLINIDWLTYNKLKYFKHTQKSLKGILFLIQEFY